MRADTMRRLVLVAAAVAVVAGAAVAVVALLGGISGRLGVPPWEGGLERRVDETRSLPLAGVESVTVAAVSSDVVIQGNSDGAVTARLSGTVRSSREDTAPRLVTEVKGSAVEIRVEHRSVVLGFLTERTRLEIALPRGYAKSLKLTTVSGDVVVDDRSLTRLQVGTTSGDVRLGAVNAESVEVSTVSGDLAANAIAAKTLGLKTTSGELRAEGLSGDAEVTSVSGEVSLRWTSLTGRATVRTTSGEVSVHLPATAGFQLDARSTSGDIACDFPLAVSGQTSSVVKHALAGTVGSGAGRLAITTVSGDIEIGK